MKCLTSQAKRYDYLRAIDERALELVKEGKDLEAAYKQAFDEAKR